MRDIEIGTRRGQRSVVERDSCGTNTGGRQADGDVVNVDIVGTHLRSEQGKHTAIAGVVGQGDFHELPRADVAHLKGGNGVEGGDIIGVAHHTHIDMAIAGRGLIGPEGEVEVAEVVRKHGQRQVAVIVGGAVEVKGIGTAVDIGRAGVGVGRRVVGMAAETGVEGCAGTSTAGVLETVAIGQLFGGNQCTEGVETGGTSQTGVARAADGTHAYSIVGAGVETGDSGRIGGDNVGGDNTSGVTHHNFPIRGIPHFGPRQGDPVARGQDGKVVHTGASGNIVDNNIVDTTRVISGIIIPFESQTRGRRWHLIKRKINLHSDTRSHESVAGTMVRLRRRWIGGNGDEGRGVVGGDITHRQHTIGTALGTHPERNLQLVQRHIHRRQEHVFRVAVGGTRTGGHHQAVAACVLIAIVTRTGDHMG